MLITLKVKQQIKSLLIIETSSVRYNVLNGPVFKEKFRVSVKAGTPPGTHPEPHPEPYPEHPEPHPEPHPEHAGIQAMKQRRCFSINSRVSH
jgi:hypothetical protein